jgi:hypothetical protein
VDRVAESAYQADNPDNPKRHFRRQTPEHHDELKMRGENHISVQDDDAMLKRASRGGNRGRETGGSRRRGKTEPVKLPEAIMASGASTKQSTGAMILNRTGIKVESDATTRVNNLTTGKELHVKLRNMRNRRNMKRGSTKNASTNDWEGGVPSAVRTRTGDSTGRTEVKDDES